MWTELKEAFTLIGALEDARAVVLDAAGKHFTVGLDLDDAEDVLINVRGDDASRKAANLRKVIRDYQDTFTMIERIQIPVISATHGACIGAGMDLITACDIRLASADAFFCVKEVDVGLAADVGTLQRLPNVIGSDSLVRDLCYTARNMYAEEAKDCGLISSFRETKEDALAGAMEIAEIIASKSPVAVQGTKHNLLYSRDNTVENALKYIAMYNASVSLRKKKEEKGST